MKNIKNFKDGGVWPVVRLDDIESNPWVLTLERKSVYGRDLFYPACDKSNILCELIGAKTLPIESLQLIKQLGFTVNLKRYDDEV